MRSPALLILATLALPAAISADAAATLKDLQQRVQRELCSAKPQCAAQADAVVVNRLTADEQLWAFSFSLKGIALPTLKATQEVQGVIEKMNARPLEVSKEKIALIFYFRARQDKMIPVGAEEFHRLTLNPKNKIVARFKSDFVLSGAVLRYEAPALWENEGLAPSTTATIQFKGTLRDSRPLRFEILNLDDQALPAVQIAACRREGDPAATQCNPLSVNVTSGTVFGVALEVRAARKIKSEQPAFKLIVKYADEADKPEAPPHLQLAIPFKPQPNYFLFGVTGFLFGGLIAAMMLFMRRRGEKPAAP
ncbi:MAG: hypothetical protein J0L53_10345 [Spirochaetes bacterium]|nr:hypothetical protein [Spirochaetota bacterium]